METPAPWQGRHVCACIMCGGHVNAVTSSVWYAFVRSARADEADEVTAST